jgi:hypothetical protein
MMFFLTLRLYKTLKYEKQIIGSNKPVVMPAFLF